MKELILIGAGGHAAACIDVINSERRYKILGIIEKDKSMVSEVNGIPIIGDESSITSIMFKNKYFLIAFGFIKNPDARINSYSKMMQLGGRPATIVASNAYVAPSASIEPGTIVMNMAIVGSGVKIGQNCIVNSRATIEHDCRIENHVHIAPAATINGSCTIGAGTFIGSGTVIRNGVCVGEKAIIGMGALVRGNVEAGELRHSQN